MNITIVCLNYSFILFIYSVAQIYFVNQGYEHESCHVEYDCVYHGLAVHAFVD